MNWIMHESIALHSSRIWKILWSFDFQYGPAINFTFGRPLPYRAALFCESWRPLKFIRTLSRRDARRVVRTFPKVKWRGVLNLTFIFLSIPNLRTIWNHAWGGGHFSQKVGSGGKSFAWFLKMWWVERRPWFRCFSLYADTTWKTDFYSRSFLKSSIRLNWDSFRKIF